MAEKTGTLGAGAYGNVAIGSSVVSALSGMMGAYYGAKNREYQLKTQALNARFQQGMSEINARKAERQIDVVMKQGHEALARMTLNAGRERSEHQVSLAARGVQGGTGSEMQMLDAIEIAKDADYYTISSNMTSAVEDVRDQVVNFNNQSLMYGVDASSFRGAASVINPEQEGFTALLGGASNVASTWARFTPGSSYDQGRGGQQNRGVR
jgi:hypothetical protein